MTEFSIIEALRTYISACPLLAADSLLFVDHLGAGTVEYGIIELPGAINLETCIDGSEFNQFPFAFQATLSTADDNERIGNGKFFELFRDWLRLQTKNKVFPVISDTKTPYNIQASNAGFVLQESETDTAVYQITCVLLYEQSAP